MSDLSLKEPFGQLQMVESRRASFGASIVVQIVFVGIVVNLSLTAPELIARHYETVTLTSPTEEKAAEPAPKPKPIIRERKIVTAPPEPVREAKIQPPPLIKVQPEQAPIIPVKTRMPVAPPSPYFESSRTDLPPGPKAAKPVVTDNFGTGSSATPTLGNRAAREVQTGGFGDPNGVPASGKGNGKGLAIAQLGSFDLPPGPGYGNGTGGARGARGTVVSSGFGNGTAIQGGGGRGGRQNSQVVKTTFTTPEVVASSTPRKAVSEDSGFTPFTILSKPLPSYTDEGRKRHIEGEVQLEVVFMASGHIRILRVLRGLGYGLDEAAIAAAQKIQFVPAKRGGQPVDAEARIRMVFQLT